MVGKRAVTSSSSSEQQQHEAVYLRKDVEDARPQKDRKYRFRDNGNLDPDDQRRVQFKKKLLDSVDKSKVLEKYRKSDEEIKNMKDKKIRAFYETQNARLDDWLEVNAVVEAISDDILESFDPRDDNGDGIYEGGGALQDTQGRVEPFLPDEEQERRRIARRNAKWAININVAANILLLIAKGIAAGYSDSLSLIASLADSALDLLCTAIIFTTHKLVEWHLSKLKRKFPVGRRRLEPLGILVFSIIMIISFLQILQESGEKLLSKGPHKATQLPPVAIGALAATIGLKGFIWIGCIRVKTTQVQALAQDCKTDVIFNSLSLIFPAVGHAAQIWWLDSLGAGLLSLFIIYDWGCTCFENVTRLSGSAVDDRTFQKLTFLAWRFSPLVDGYKSIQAYHAGDGVWVEVDVLLDEKTPLEMSHDISETLQYCLEGLPEVDRAFISCDYTTWGPTGHAAENAGE